MPAAQNHEPPRQAASLPIMRCYPPRVTQALLPEGARTAMPCPFNVYRVNRPTKPVTKAEPKQVTPFSQCRYILKISRYKCVGQRLSSYLHLALHY